MKIIIIGAGPVGAYTAGLCGYAGLEVEVFEKSKRAELKQDIGIIHFDVQDYEILGIPRPPQDHPMFLGTFEKLWQVPFDVEKKFSIDYPTDILHFTPFINWIIDYANQSGNVDFYFDAPFERPLIENNQLVGVQIGNNIGEKRGSCVIDCTGMHAIVRNSLPPELGIKPVRCRDGRLFRLHMEKWMCKSSFPHGSNTYVSFKGFANQVGEHETLIGTSTLGSWETTKEMFNEMIRVQNLEDIEHTVLETFAGEVPYDFPPASLVGPGFLSIGDSGFQNKPFNGEGMVSGMRAAQIALPVIIDAAEENDFSVESLWPYNVNYFRTLGADFAMIRGTGETLVDLTPEEFNWMFDKGFMNKKMLQSTWEKYQASFSFKTMLAAFHGLRRWQLFKKILRGIKFGTKFKKLYKKYPKTPDGLDKWQAKFENLITQI